MPQQLVSIAVYPAPWYTRHLPFDHVTTPGLHMREQWFQKLADGRLGRPLRSLLCLLFPLPQALKNTVLDSEYVDYRRRTKTP